MFFEDNIDDAKYCGHLYGLGTSYVNGGQAYSGPTSNSNNNSSWYMWSVYFNPVSSRFLFHILLASLSQCIIFKKIWELKKIVFHIYFF